VKDEARERFLPCPERRRTLKVLGAAVGAAALTPLAGLTGCAPNGSDERKAAAEDQPVRVPLDRLAVGARLTVQVAGTPVELHRTEDGVTGRSLRCTHFGCTVIWTPARNAYVCPCHDGAYGPDGHVIFGPPPAPLAAVPVTLEGDTVVVQPPSHGPAGAPGSAEAGAAT